MQIERLKNEKTQLLNHIRSIKLILQKLKHNDKQRLIDISVNSNNCISKLEDSTCTGNKLICLYNLCSKYETDREKHSSNLDLVNKKKEHFTIEEKEDIIMEDEEYYKNMKNKDEENAKIFENFFKTKNKAFLDVIILRKEYQSLKKKNKEYNKIIDELENKLNLNKKAEINKEGFVIKTL